MIARPEAVGGGGAERLRVLRDEITDELRSASFIVADDDSARALLFVGLSGASVTRTEDVIAEAVRAAGVGSPVVIVQAVDGAMREYVNEHVPDAEIRDVRLAPGTASVAAMLGWDSSVQWDAAECSTRAAQFVEWCAEKSLASVSAGSAPARFPVSAFPRVLREFVNQAADALSIDPAFVGVPLLGVLAGSIGATRRVRIKAGWSEPSILWTATVAVSGTGKSPGQDVSTEPLRDHNRALHQRNEDAHRQFAAEFERWEQEPKDHRGAKPERPPILAATVDDLTMEALSARLLDNTRGLVASPDELASWVRTQDQYRRGGDAQRWLSIYGSRDYSVDRKGGASGPERVLVRRPCVSVIGGIQPSIARKYLAGSEQRESGALARVLLAAPPITPARLTTRFVPAEVRDAYGRVVRSLLDLRFDDDGEPIDLPLTPTAFERFRVWHDRVADDGASAARSGDEDCSSMLAKVRGAATRIALALALARAAEDGVAELLRVVDDEDMANAIALADYFSNQATGIYRRWSDDAASDQADREGGSLRVLADRLDVLLRSGPKDREDFRDLTGRNVRAPRMDAALAILFAEGRAAKEQSIGPRGGRPREVWTSTAGVSA